MVFSSVPVYSDHPNWHQLDQPINQGCGSQNYPLWPPPPPPPPPQAGGGGGQIKPNSMVDRAQLAKVPQPEKGLKCPRCESNNTKFCYFNNYNLSQPRHFCKTCRRYWTKGGTLRNIPVGGGCRKNKRSKSKSKSSKSHQVMITSASTTPSRCSTYTPNDFPSLSPHMQVPFMDSSLNCCGGNMGIIGFEPKMAAEGGDGGGEASFGFQTGFSSNFLSVGGAEQWRSASLTGLEPPENFFPYQSEAAAVKMEENYSKLGLNLSRQFMGVSGNNDNQYWSRNQWQEISGLSSSPTSNLL